MLLITSELILSIYCIRCYSLYLLHYNYYELYVEDQVYTIQSASGHMPEGWRFAEVRNLRVTYIQRLMAAIGPCYSNVVESNTSGCLLGRVEE